MRVPRALRAFFGVIFDPGNPWATDCGTARNKFFALIANVLCVDSVIINQDDPAMDGLVR
jgi:hypothetical protein